MTLSGINKEKPANQRADGIFFNSIQDKGYKSLIGSVISLSPLFSHNVSSVRDLNIAVRA